MFFAPRNKETALGMYTPLYFIALAVCIILIIVGLILSRKMNKKQVYKTLVIIGIFLWITEIIKMIFYFVTYGLEDVDFIPLLFKPLLANIRPPNKNFFSSISFRTSGYSPLTRSSH